MIQLITNIIILSSVFVLFYLISVMYCRMSIDRMNKLQRSRKLYIQYWPVINTCIAIIDMIYNMLLSIYCDLHGVGSGIVIGIRYISERRKDKCNDNKKKITGADR